MADRTVSVGDTYPDVYLSVSDETGVLDLSTAASIEVQFIGAKYEFSGAGAAVQPPTIVDGVSYNLSYAFAAADTSEADVYAIFAVVTWTTGTPNQVETFPTSDTLTVKALPTVA